MQKNVLITGASRGIGRETAIAFAKEGYNVVINYLNSESNAELLEKEICVNFGNAVAIRADVSSFEDVQKMVSHAECTFGKIDVLVNNAGIAQQKLFTDITDDDWNKMININLKGAFNCCKAVLPGMIQRKNGCIINVSSMWGQIGASCEVHYSAAKAGLIGLTKALAKEVGPSNIRVNSVSPGMIDTDMNSGFSEDTLCQLRDETPLGRIGKSSDVADLIVFLASDKASFITGQNIAVNGGLVI